ncbi:hypothetical protein HC761_00255, partial [bacterium]|nr:hypothetical protein [bacterium]
MVLADDIFGKPADIADAARMLARLSGRTHEVLSSIALVTANGHHHALQRSYVQFKRLSQAEIDAYLGCQESIGKAGAYAIQGRAAGFGANDWRVTMIVKTGLAEILDELDFYYRAHWHAVNAQQAGRPGGCRHPC